MQRHVFRECHLCLFSICEFLEREFLQHSCSAAQLDVSADRNRGPVELGQGDPAEAFRIGVGHFVAVLHELVYG